MLTIQLSHMSVLWQRHICLFIVTSRGIIVMSFRPSCIWLCIQNVYMKFTGWWTFELYSTMVTFSYHDKQKCSHILQCQKLTKRPKSLPTIGKKSSLKSSKGYQNIFHIQNHFLHESVSYIDNVCIYVCIFIWHKYIADRITIIFK